MYTTTTNNDTITLTNNYLNTIVTNFGVSSQININPPASTMKGMIVNIINSNSSGINTIVQFNVVTKWFNAATSNLSNVQMSMPANTTKTLLFDGTTFHAQ